MNTINKLYVRFFLAVIASIALGITAALLWEFLFPSALTTLFIIFGVSAVVLLVIFIYFLPSDYKKPLPSYKLLQYIRFIFAGAIGSFVFSVILLSLVLTAESVLDAVLFGITTGFFALLLLGLIIFVLSSYNNSDCR